MAAGLGFKTFATGDVLTAGDTNGYLMQGVLVRAHPQRTQAVGRRTVRSWLLETPVCKQSETTSHGVS